MSFQVFIDGNPGFFRYFGMIFYFFSIQWWQWILLHAVFYHSCYFSLFMLIFYDVEVKKSFDLSDIKERA